MDNQVYIVQCKDYTDIEEKVATLINLMGGMGRFALNNIDLIMHSVLPSGEAEKC